ncbi:MAG: hypothetical protein CVV44_08890 [Spirochaetae bacterium HGW-Spirochaetae-1]|nr:MAG: hypothetical protein CVV44_08890 [Spirochaetae bacterium HGW-Spirochaetae-1]
MKKSINSLILIMCAAVLIAASEVRAQDAAEDSAGLGISAGVEYMSDYLWRGGYWYGGDGAFFPSLSYNVLDTGLSLGVSAELSDAWMFDGRDFYNGTNVRDLHATDFGADYSYTFGDAVTVGAGLWYYLLWNNDYSFLSGYVSATIDMLPLSPTVTYTHDYYTESGDASDFYIQLGVSHGFELMKDASLDLGAVAGYYYADSTNQKGISDIDFSTALTVTKGIISYSAGFHYVIVPSKDFYYGTDGAKDINRFYATFGVSCGI